MANLQGFFQVTFGCLGIEDFGLNNLKVACVMFSNPGLLPCVSQFALSGIQREQVCGLHLAPPLLHPLHIATRPGIKLKTHNVHNCRRNENTTCMIPVTRHDRIVSRLSTGPGGQSSSRSGSGKASRLRAQLSALTSGGGDRSRG